MFWMNSEVFTGSQRDLIEGDMNPFVALSASVFHINLSLQG